MSPALSVNPKAAGLSPERLGRIRARMEKHIDAGRMAGGVGLIMRRGHVGYFETWSMNEDAILRIYSMTKAVTGAAAMMLFEEGEFALADPIANFIPEFSEMRVAVESTDPATGKIVLTRTVPAARRITMLDLMRHTTGFNYTGPHDENGGLIYGKQGILADLSRSPAPGDLTSVEFVKRLAGIPLVCQPGTAWDYGLGTDVLGRIVEIISGRTLAEFFAERIFQPLGMTDTDFHVHADQWDRFVPIFSLTPTGAIQKMTGPIEDSFRRPPKMFAGGSGLTSSVFDYLRFVRMLRSGGELDGERLLSPVTVELMRSDMLGNLPVVHPLLTPGHGFGLTFAVSRGPGQTGTLASAGQYRWGGIAGTAFWIDPSQDMVGIFMMQTMRDAAKRSEFMQLAYQSIVE
jgi:CubicO group peptidase (beta-lactamase class C family)